MRHPFESFVAGATGPALLVASLACAGAGVLGCNEIAGISEGILATGSSGASTAASSSTGAAGSGGSTSSGGSGGAGATSTTGSGGCEPLAQNTCDSCLVTECAETYCECAAKPDCTSFGACAGAAVSQAEIQSCWQKYPDSVALSGRLHVCGNAKCPSCGFAAVDACTACEYEKCSAEVDGCLESADCVALLLCFEQCVGDPACNANCSVDHPQGAGKASTLQSCAKRQCASACN